MSSGGLVILEDVWYYIKRLFEPGLSHLASRVVTGHDLQPIYQLKDTKSLDYPRGLP